jgi:hypothetical protein
MTIEIWAPRYKDDVVLIAQRKVSDNNVIVFTKAKHLLGQKYYVSEADIRAATLETNGKIPCYAVPMNKLTLIGEVL